MLVLQGSAGRRKMSTPKGTNVQVPCPGDPTRLTPMVSMAAALQAGPYVVPIGYTGPLPHLQGYFSVATVCLAAVPVWRCRYHVKVTKRKLWL